MNSVLQEWVGECCTMKMQTVLLCALRGCEGERKEDHTKPLTRAIRAAVLRCAEGGGSVFSRDDFDLSDARRLASDFDHYPVHWLAHTMHALEIIGYKHPAPQTAARFLSIYYALATGLHLLPESEAHLDCRLADRPYDDAARREYAAVAAGAPQIVEMVVTKTEARGYRG